MKELYLDTYCDSPNQASAENTSGLYWDTNSLIDANDADTHDMGCVNPSFDTLHDNISFHMETKSNTKADNKHTNPTVRCPKHSMNTSYVENNTAQSSMICYGEVNRDMTGGNVSQEPNAVTVVPNDVLFKESNQSINNLAQSSRRNVVDNGEYDAINVKTDSGSESRNNNKINVDPKTNNNAKKKP